MPTNLFKFDNSYLQLPEGFYSKIRPTTLQKAELLLFNEELAAQLDISFGSATDFIAALQAEDPQNPAFAQAYAGHQFSSFTRLGDGRAVVLGEQLTSVGQRFDIQVKGSGRTPYSRGGDGKATVYAMLREYLISEAMFHLGVPTSRSLAVFKTGETVYRQTNNEGAALLRVMESHIRVGTFQFASFLGKEGDLEALLHYTIERLYPHLAGCENPALALFHEVMNRQIDLVVHWMRVGFIHGVMNTDNSSVSGESFDYGPCAFMNAYHPATVYSSIDEQGRYAFGNQPNIIKWNLARFAEALLPLMAPEKEAAIALAQDALDAFDARWKRQYQGMMLHKLGIEATETAHFALVEQLLDLMEQQQLDFTNTFATLLPGHQTGLTLPENEAFQSWYANWQKVIITSSSCERASELMAANNPLYIPRNHLVEEALEAANKGSLEPFETMLRVVRQPYTYRSGLEKFRQGAEPQFEEAYQTFCGT
ncbi:MAG: YdiU family protein [Sphingobacteriaceae bacterium]|nr:YdiU family protein [Sphingobacteriaceae bacterium]